MNQASGAYSQEAAEFDLMLDETIAGIRDRQAAGQITARQAADERVTALSEHLATVKALRAEHFGGDQ